MLLFVLTSCLLTQPQPTPPPQGEPVAAAADLSTLSFAELLARIPEAGEEHRWDAASKSWQEDPASVELHRRIIRGDLSNDQWPLALEAARVIAVPRRWPKDHPLAISLNAPLWLGEPGWVEATPKIAGAMQARQPATGGMCALGNDAWREARRYIVVGGPLDPSTTQVTFDVRLEARRTDGDHATGHERRWHGTLSFPIKIVDSDADVSEPIKDPAFDRAVKNAVRVSMALNSESPQRYAMWVTATRTPELAPFLEKHACRAKVELLDGTKVLEEVDFDLRQTPGSPARASQYIRSVPETLLRDEAQRSRLRLRITGLTEESFKDLRRSSCWAGQVEGALSEFTEKK
jgi:hypothetical protein